METKKHLNSSWADKVRVSDASTKFTLDSLPRQVDGRLQIPEEVLQESTNQCCTRLDYAQVCVELDATLPFVHTFEMEYPLFMEPITVEVDYEWKPSRCSKCKYFGHSCSVSSEANDPIDEASTPIPLVVTGEKEQGNANHNTGHENPNPNENPQLSLKSLIIPLNHVIPKLPKKITKGVANDGSATATVTPNPPIPPVNHVIPKTLQKTTNRGADDGSATTHVTPNPPCTTSRMVSPSCSITDQDPSSPLASSQTSLATTISPIKLDLTVHKKKITFVYGLHTHVDRQPLWSYLVQESAKHTTRAWLVLGDFNAVMKLGDRAGGDLAWHGHNDDFPMCMHSAQLAPFPYSDNLQSTRRSDHVIAKLLLSCTVYHVWYERNSRIFKQQFKTSQQVQREILDIVRDQLAFIPKTMRLTARARSEWGLDLQ
ncbi:hypothetical protein SADUNF_Sadunf17G0139100 [Salix dunnii]|uniref:Uncharacterized protein n=1 Tax=Salix dunnii TaxID=1413687 RepID=A0A835J6E2_9ROSI|nr:hypothetical protein SADUNF_Sadunf17G0139100 [Salix dunnii]